VDIALNLSALALDAKSLQADLGVTGGDLTSEDSLRTAVIMSLFLDRRANDDDTLPDGSTDKRGWWGDAYSENGNDLTGSRLWLLQAEKQLPAVLVRAREYAQEALDWFVKDGVAKSVDVSADFPRDGMLGLTIVITKPDGTRLQYQFSILWGQ